MVGGTADFGLSVSLAASVLHRKGVTECCGSTVVQCILPVGRVRVAYTWMRM